MPRRSRLAPESLGNHIDHLRHEDEDGKSGNEIGDHSTHSRERDTSVVHFLSMAGCR